MPSTGPLINTTKYPSNRKSTTKSKNLSVIPTAVNRIISVVACAVVVAVVVVAVVAVVVQGVWWFKRSKRVETELSFCLWNTWFN